MRVGDLLATDVKGVEEYDLEAGVFSHSADVQALEELRVWCELDVEEEPAWGCRDLGPTHYSQRSFQDQIGASGVSLGVLGYELAPRRGF